MKRSIALAAVLGFVLFASAAGAAGAAGAAAEGAPRPHHRRHPHHGVTPVPRVDTRSPVGGRAARRAVEPSMPRKPDAGGGDDGLSTNPDNCNTGCVGGNPD